MRGQYVLVGTLPPLSDPFLNNEVNRLNSRILSTGAQFDVPIADHNARLRNGFFRYSFDGVTINDQGHRIMAEVWIDAIYAALENTANQNEPICRSTEFIIDDGRDAQCAALDRACQFDILSFSFFGDNVRNTNGGTKVFAYGESLGVNVTRLTGSNAVYTVDWSNGINAGAIEPLDQSKPGVISEFETKVDEFSNVTIRPGFMGEFNVTIRAQTNFGGGIEDCCFLPWDSRVLEAPSGQGHHYAFGTGCQLRIYCVPLPCCCWMMKTESGAKLEIQSDATT